MSKDYPDFGELQQVFETYKASIRTEPLLGADALDRLFAQAPAKISLLRRIRIQWAVGITGLAIVTTGLIMELSRTTETPPVTKPNIPVRVDTTPAVQKMDTTAVVPSDLEVDDFRLSKYNYDSHLNLDSVIRYDPNLGPDFREADYDDLEKFCTSPERVDTLIQTLNWPLLVSHGIPGGLDSIYPGTPDSMRNFFVSWEGKRWVMPDAQGFHFFVGRWDHHRPKWWQRYAQIDNDHLDLGAWTDVHFRILGVRK